MSRGRRRRNRGRALVAVGAATCVAGVGVALVERGSGAPPPRRGGGIGVNRRATATPTLEFRAVNGTVAYSSSHFTTAAGVTYALSTAPGDRPAELGPGLPRPGDLQHERRRALDHRRPGRGLDHRSLGAQRRALRDRHRAGRHLTRPTCVTASARRTTAAPRGPTPTCRSTSTAPSANVSLYRSSSVHIASSPTATVALLTEQFSPNLDSMVAARTAGHPNVEPTTDRRRLLVARHVACVSAKGADRGQEGERRSRCASSGLGAGVHQPAGARHDHVVGPRAPRARRPEPRSRCS